MLVCFDVHIIHYKKETKILHTVMSMFSVEHLVCKFICYKSWAVIKYV